jgi:hypothetical protein
MRRYPRSIYRVFVLLPVGLSLAGFDLLQMLTVLLVVVGLAILALPLMKLKRASGWRVGLWAFAGLVGVALVLTDVTGGTTVQRPNAPVVVKQLVADSGTILWAENNTLKSFAPAEGTEQTAVTLPDAAMASDLALSSSGDRYALAYAPNANGNVSVDDLLKIMDLYLLPRSGGSPTLLLTHDQAGGGMSTPAWSTDGNFVYVTVTNAETSASSIVRVAVRDGSTTKIADQASDPNCAPDGKTLVFVHRQPSDGYAEIWRSNLDGSHARAIKGSRFSNVVSPVVSPDDKTVAFSAPYIPTQQGRGGITIPFFSPSSASAHGGNWEVWTLSMKGGKATVRTAFAENAPRLVWSPSGDSLAVNADLGLYVIDLKQNKTDLFELNTGSGLVWAR